MKCNICKLMKKKPPCRWGSLLKEKQKDDEAEKCKRFKKIIVPEYRAIRF